MNAIIALMLGVSILLAFIALGALIWGINTRQFEDYEKFLAGTKYDSEDSLNDAYKMEQRRKQASKKGYMPPD